MEAVCSLSFNKISCALFFSCLDLEVSILYHMPGRTPHHTQHTEHGTARERKEKKEGGSDNFFF